MLYRGRSSIYGRIGALLVALVIAVFLSQYLYHHEVKRIDTPPPISASGEELQMYWRERIDRDPAPEVYDDFVRTYAAQDVNLQHGVMHVFASLLYERYGFEALKFCDSSFQEACYHELASSLSYEGRLVDKDAIDSFCEGNWDCLHGIGHGLVMYFGYDEAGLSSVLKRCPEEPWQMDFIEGCRSGVFMEYLTRTMGMLRDETAKGGDQAGLDFCKGVEEPFRRPCQFVMVERVIADTDQTLPEMTEDVGAYCLHHASGYEDVCFRGAGFDIKLHIHAHDEGSSFCRSISGRNDEYADECLIMLAMQYQYYGDHDSSKEVCDMVSPSRRERCGSS